MHFSRCDFVPDTEVSPSGALLTIEKHAAMRHGQLHQPLTHDRQCIRELGALPQSGRGRGVSTIAVIV
jgi:hypothetical protein